MNFQGNWLTSHSIKYKFIRLLATLICIIILFVIPFSIYLVHAQNDLFAKQEQLREKARIVSDMEETIQAAIFHARGYYAYHLDSELSQARSLLAKFDKLIDDYSALPLTEQELKLRGQFRDFSTNYQMVLLPRAVALVNSGNFQGLQEFASGDGGKEINEFLAFAQSYNDRTDQELSQDFRQAEKRTNQWILMALLFSGLILFAFVVIMWRILLDIIRPLSDLGDAAEALIHGQNVELKELRRKDEIGLLSNSFNHMVRSLQDKEEELLAQNEELTTQQEELQSNQERLQRSLTEIESMTKALDQSSAVAILDRNGIFQYVNNKLCEWTLYKSVELVGRSYLMLTMPGHEGAVVGEIGRITRTGGTWSGDVLNRKRDGSGLWLQNTVVPYVDSKGAVYQYIMIGNNISPLKQTEEELARSLSQTEKTKEELEVYNQLNRELTSTLDRQEFAESFLAHINKLYSLQASLFLIMEDRVIAAKGLGDEAVAAFAKESMNGLYARLSEERSFVVKREASVSEQGIAAGSLVYSYDFYSGVTGANHELTGMFCATRIGNPFLPEEINAINGQMNRVALALERINLFGAIEKSRKLNRNIINNVLEGIQFVDPDGQMLQSNDALCRMLGRNDWATEERIGREEWVSGFTKLVHDERALRQFFDKALSSPVTDDYTLQYTLAKVGESGGLSKGSARHMEVYATSLFQQAEKIGTIFVHRDMTKEFELDQMKTELVSTVSHELRTPLSSVLGFAELLLTKNLKPERQLKYAETIHKEAKRLTNLINDFLDLQRMESGSQQYNMEHCPLDSLVMEVVNHFRHDKRHQVIFLDEARDVRVNADRERMIQVLTNLMSNAIKFSPEGGRVTVRLSNDAMNVICSVEDKGIGIPKHELPTLFQKFKRIDNSASRKIGGTGLGLAICKEIVAKHNGSIWIESEEGQGTTIYFSLPLVSCQVVAGVLSDETAAGKESPSRGNVMIVEDDMSLALLLSEELKMHSFKVMHHYNPNFALEDALKTKLVGMVVDLMLGDEMDGWDLIGELKSHAETAEIPIVVSSALDLSEEKLQKYNIERYLTKPYPSGELTKVIMEFFTRSQGSGVIAFPKGRGE